MESGIKPLPCSPMSWQYSAPLPVCGDGNVKILPITMRELWLLIVVLTSPSCVTVDVKSGDLSVSATGPAQQMDRVLVEQGVDGNITFTVDPREPSLIAQVVRGATSGIITGLFR